MGILLFWNGVAQGSSGDTGGGTTTVVAGSGDAPTRSTVGLKNTVDPQQVFPVGVHRNALSGRRRAARRLAALLKKR